MLNISKQGLITAGAILDSVSEDKNAKFYNALNPNLFQGTNEGRTAWNHGAGNSTSLLASYPFETGSGIILTVEVPATNWLYLLYYPTNNAAIKAMFAVAGNTYTLSCDVYCSVATTVNFYYMAGNAVGNQIVNKSAACTVGWNHVSVTTTSNGTESANQALYISGFNKVGEFIVKNLKLEEGSVATPYCSYGGGTAKGCIEGQTLTEI